MTARKTSTIYAPKELRSSKTLRVEWLQAKVAELTADGLEARISGTGSLQCVKWTTRKVVTTKMQLRGLCQCCGRLQALHGGRLVKHGYERPGYGYQTASCAGTWQLPLSESCDYARGVEEQLTGTLASAKTPNERYHMQNYITFLQEVVKNWTAGHYAGTTKEYEVQV